MTFRYLMANLIHSSENMDKLFVKKEKSSRRKRPVSIASRSLDKNKILLQSYFLV